MNTEWVPPRVLLTVDLVVLTLREMALCVLLVERGIDPYQGHFALPGGFLSDDQEGVEEAARRELAEETGLDDRKLHLEQLAVFGRPGRDPRGRVVSIAFLAIAPELPEPSAGTDAAEARWQRVEPLLAGTMPLAFDHAQILAVGVERARARIESTPLATAFCGEVFTIPELQRVYEAVWGASLDPRNFYRKVQAASGFLVSAGPPRRAETGRPARVFRVGECESIHPPIVRAKTLARRKENADE